MVPISLLRRFLFLQEYGSARRKGAALCFPPLRVDALTLSSMFLFTPILPVLFFYEKPRKIFPTRQLPIGVFSGSVLFILLA